MYNRVLNPAFAGLVLGLLSLPVFSADLDWGIEATVGHTDNATRVSSDEISDTIGSIGGHIDVTREGSRIDGRLRGRGSYRDYFDNTYSSEFLGSAAGELRIGLIGESLTWSAAETFGQVLSNSLAPSTPDNREDVSLFNTGPDLRLKLGKSTNMIIRGRYQDSRYQNDDNANNNRITGDIALVRHTSPSVGWSLNATASNVDYDDKSNPGYDQQEVMARLEAKGASQTLTAGLGMGFVDGEDQTDQGLVARLDWIRKLGSSWSLELGARSEFANSDDQFIHGIAASTELGGTQDVELTGRAMRNDNANMALRFVHPRTRLRFYGGIGQETYPDTIGQDRSRWSLGVEATRDLTAHLEATIALFHEDRDFDTSADKDKTDRYSARLDWRIGRSLFLGIEGRKEDRSGNTTYSYDETIYLASISYRTGAL